MIRAAFAALCLALTAGFTALGVWQVERRAWKLDLIDKVETRIHAAPAPLPADWNGDHAYRRVRATGQFLHDRETFVQAVTARGPGWWVIIPLRVMQADSAGPRLILVNRGYVPNDRRDQATRRAALPAGMVTVTGLLRDDEPGGAFLRSNDPVADRWFSRDVTAIAASRGLPSVAPMFIDADAAPNPGGYPVGGLTVVAFRNNHLMYAITWFGLAALSLFGAVKVIRSRARPSQNAR